MPYDTIKPPFSVIRQGSGLAKTQSYLVMFSYVFPYSILRLYCMIVKGKKSVSKIKLYYNLIKFQSRPLDYFVCSSSFFFPTRCMNIHEVSERMECVTNMTMTRNYEVLLPTHVIQNQSENAFYRVFTMRWDKIFYVTVTKHYKNDGSILPKAVSQ